MEPGTLAAASQEAAAPPSSSRQDASGRLFGVLIHRGPPEGPKSPKKPDIGGVTDKRLSLQQLAPSQI